jgi:peroxiredoxin
VRRIRRSAGAGNAGPWVHRLRSTGILAAALICAAIPHAVHAEEAGQQRAREAGRELLGTPAPRLALTTIDGERIDLGALYGKKAVYLKFWATWCVPCRQQMQHFQHAFETAGSDLAVIAIDVGFNDSIAAIQTYRKKLGITMPIVFDDGSLGAAFHLRVTPTHIVIGRDGRIRYVGHLADAELDAALIAARHADTPGAAGADTGGRARRQAETPARPEAPVAVGGSLPKLTLHTLDGEPFELRPDARARPVTALVFISPWCESYLEKSRPEAAAQCKAARAEIEGLSKDSRVRWIGIASGLWANEDDLDKYRHHYGVTIPVTLDASGGVFRRFRVNEVPTILIADGKGRVLRRIDADAAGNGAALRRAIESAAATPSAN